MRQTAVSGHTEIVAKVNAAHIVVLHHIVRGSRHQYLAIVQDIGTVDDFQRFAHVVVGNQNADSAFLKVGDKVTNITDADRVDACKGFIQKKVLGVSRQASCDFDPPPLAPPCDLIPELFMASLSLLCLIEELLLLRLGGSSFSSPSQ